jgi:hypothetical protein
MKFLRLLSTLPLLSTALGASPRLAMGDNESMLYRVSWAILPGAGEITINGHAATDPEGTALRRVVTRTATRGLAHLILPFEARAESLFDVASGRLLWLGESSTTRDKQDAHSVTFNYDRHLADYEGGLTPGPVRTLALPAGFPTDLITCLVQARTWKIPPGGSQDALVLFEDEFYELTVHDAGTEDISTPLGTFSTQMLEPRMERTPPKGMFKRGSKVKVWISQDARRLPVRFKVEFKFGSGVATLAEYRPPTATLEEAAAPR